MKNKKQGFISTKIILIIVGVLVVGGGAWYGYKTIFSVEVTDKACEKDTKQCPDGSYVERILFRCDFAECPDINAIENQRDVANTSILQTTKSIEVTNNPTTCTDSDEGKDYYVKGKTYGTIYAQGPATRTWEDFCSTEEMIQEYSCKELTSENSSDVEVTYYRCLNGCVEGKCLSDPTVDWKTYRNEEYGFEVKYPNKNYNAFEIKPNLSHADKFLLDVNLGLNNGSFTLKIRISENTDKKYDKNSLHNAITKWYGSSNWPYDKTEEFNVDNHLATKGNYIAEGEGGITEPAVEVFTLNSQYVYKIDYSGNIENGDQILSTFKFISIPI